MFVEPYLDFDGRCEEAIEFYRKAVGAKREMVMYFKDGPNPEASPPGSADKVMHASFTIGNSRVMASDGNCQGQPKFEGLSLSISVDSDEKAERTFAALSDGGEVEMPLAKTFWTSKFGMVKDRFGVSWMVSVFHELH